MRKLIFILFFISSLAIKAESFTVFEKDGYFGIKDETGSVTVPAVYEKLGWSNGSTQVYNGVIGFRQDKLWGLITVRNKALTGQKFYTIEPILYNYFKASIKGRFSNHLFHGILDEKGRTIISFNYFTVEPLGVNWLVSTFDGKRQQFGVASFQNQLIIPTEYESILVEKGLFIAKQNAQRFDMFLSSGRPILSNLDSIFYDNGWVVYQDGYAGFLSSKNALIYDFDFKGFTRDGEAVTPISFPEWTVYKEDSIYLKWLCDSLTVTAQGTLMAYLNGAHHLLLKNSTLLSNHQLVLREASKDQMIVQNSQTRKWSILSESGSELVSGYDSIFTVGNHYGCVDSKGLYLLNRKGQSLNRLPLQDLRPGLSGQFLAKKHNYWGIIGSDQQKVTFKYDSIVTIGNRYLISYLNRWGAMNDRLEWVVRSEFNEIISMGSLIIGRRGRGYTIHYKGTALYKSVARPVKKLGTFILIRNDSSAYGLMNAHGKMVVMPEYSSIRLVAGRVELTSKRGISLMTPHGKTILKEADGYQQISGFGEGYFVVKKGNRWGFVDNLGRLRISNRYAGASPFSEGMAAIKLRGKWGFIDKDETLRIQPYYDKVHPFKNKRAIAQLDGQFGLIDEHGKEVLEFTWKSIHRLNTDNYIVRDMDNRVGLADEAGTFIFRPSFEYLEDFGDRILVSQNGFWGVLSYSGHPIFKINNEEIKVMGDFTMVKN